MLQCLPSCWTSENVVKSSSALAAQGKCSRLRGPGCTLGLSAACSQSMSQRVSLVLPCCLGSANVNYKIVLVKRVMLGKAALLCGSAQLEYMKDRVEDLLLL